MTRLKQKLDFALENIEQIEQDGGRVFTSPKLAIIKELLKGKHMRPIELSRELRQYPPATRRDLAQLLQHGIVTASGSHHAREYFMDELNIKAYDTYLREHNRTTL